jgi:hypothetical protein
VSARSKSGMRRVTDSVGSVYVTGCWGVEILELVLEPGRAGKPVAEWAPK